MHFACWVRIATNTHSEYVSLLLFHGSSGSVLRYTYSTLHVVLFLQ